MQYDGNSGARDSLRIGSLFRGSHRKCYETNAGLITAAAGIPPTFWSSGDKISVFSSGQTGSPLLGYEFFTTLDAITSSKEDKRAVNFTAQPDNRNPKNYEGNAYRIAQVEIPSSQILNAGGLDRNAMAMVAYAKETADLDFKNAVALVKFKVTDSDIVSGQISAADKISGIYRADILANTLEPVMVDYRKATCSNVSFRTSGNAPLIPGVEYYVAVRPTKLTEGFKIVLNGKEVKSYPEVKEFKRNTVYDLGTLNLLRDKVLTFNFTDASGDVGQEFVTGGKPVLMSGGPGTKVQFNLGNTAVNTVYWIRLSPETTSLKSVILTYAECEMASEVDVRIGTYNLNVAKSSDTGGMHGRRGKAGL